MARKAKTHEPKRFVSNATVIVGVDPGLSGALAFYDQLSDETHVVDMPTKWIVRNGKRRRKIDALELALVIDLYAAGRPLAVYSEQVGAMPGQGVTSMFSFGRAVGVVDGEFGAAGEEPKEVTPHTWQKALGLNAKGDKSKHRALAAKLYPKIAHLFARQKDDGRADAALILTYGRQQEQK